MVIINNQLLPLLKKRQMSSMHYTGIKYVLEAINVCLKALWAFVFGE